MTPEFTIKDEDMEAMAQRLLVADAAGGRIYLMGNGGSASTASHIVNDLYAAGINAVSLCDNIALIMAIANDKSYSDVFSDQLRGRLTPHDVVIGISGRQFGTHSENIVKAIALANEAGAYTVGLLGFGDGKIKDMVKMNITLPSTNYGVIESTHLLILHKVCDTVTRRKNGYKAVFIDRDGTMAEDVHYCSMEEDFHLFPRTGEAIRLLNEHYKVVVVTNQSGIGRGYFTEETLERIHWKMRRELAREGAYVDDIFFCPHHPDDNCDCRKPKPKLVYQAAIKHNINLAKSVVIGDTEMDAQLAEKIGIRSIILYSQKHDPSIHSQFIGGTCTCGKEPVCPDCYMCMNCGRMNFDGVWINLLQAAESL